jgi:hypothetical protein
LRGIDLRRNKICNNFLTVLFFCRALLLFYFENPDDCVQMAVRGEKGMAAVDEIGQERQRIADRLARLDAERTKLVQQLEELEIAERVLSRFARPVAAARRGRARPVTTATAADARRGSPAGKPQDGLSLSDATLRAVAAHGAGATAAEVMTYLTGELGMTVRPNHLAISLQRHRRAGRLENRDGRWFHPSPAAASHFAVAG